MEDDFKGIDKKLRDLMTELIFLEDQLALSYFKEQKPHPITDSNKQQPAS